MDNVKVLWVDDEVDLLKPHVMFLEEKGYSVDTVNNGQDALEMIEEERYDIVFLDENMPGWSGLETLGRIKKIAQNLPVVMITKSEEESIMEDAIGSQISDYLIKPVNPKQILLSLKKNLDTRRLVSEKTTMNYQQEFRQIGMDLSSIDNLEEWFEIYQRLIYWELELDRIQDDGLREVLSTQKEEANKLFGEYIEESYEDWFSGKETSPIMSNTVFHKRIAPRLGKGKPVFLFVIDNLRWDQWKVIQPDLEQELRVTEEDPYLSILPTATHYARNSFFAGLMPLEIKKRFPQKWMEEGDDEGKNMFEEDFLLDQMRRIGLGDLKVAYHKITNLNAGKKLADRTTQLLQNDLVVIVYNFVDMLSHSKTEMEVIRELADNDKAYRSLTQSWFRNSPLWEIMRQLSGKNVEIAVTTDHGTINVTEPTKIVGERNLNTNLRYKIGRNMTYSHRDVFEVRDPEAIHLPKQSLSDVAVFAKEDYFFAYPNNFNHYVKYYRNTYQHGGLSLEEMIIPIVWLAPR